MYIINGYHVTLA